MRKIARFFLGFLTVNLLWLTGAALIQSRALPGPFTVYTQFGNVLSAGLPRHILASLWRVSAGLGVAVGIGTPLGLLMAGAKKWDRALCPIVYFLYPVPKTALLPVAMLLLGLGDGSKILILALTVVFQIVVAVRDAAKAVESTVYQVAVSAGAGRWSLLRHVTLPAILPSVLTGLRVGAGTSLAVLFLVEAYGTRFGLGYYILDAWARIDYVEMYGGIVVISLVGATLFLAADLLSRRLCRWQGGEKP